ncbi:lactate dehydrogenase [Actinomycetospora sp. NBRC 106375]|uniref:FAD-binding and (Fe-S)-binding domain-containing protein n=1 Tax=Actinomycetospora sp. NBRC 106375 TaxID=3032207 RepID=UPI0024A090F0|nr:FAD-binding and (Fe-S)-binding domain-containing protein [Actinomycetospora sp. NBRC 106375]GLZ49214.1 lactate dehydrogenase [Actinomycetospora sp. NBRC 106375]
MTTMRRSSAESLLAEDLRSVVRGRVRFDTASKAMWSADASNYRHVPLGVVQPVDLDDVEATVDVARRHGVPVLPRGASTSIGGQAVNEAVIVDFSRHLTRVLDIDPDARTARVQPGVVLDDLRDAARPYGLTFGPDPSTHNRCTLGGMIANNACGSHSVAWGKTVDNVRELEILLVDGTRMAVGRTPDLAAAMNRPGREGAVYRELQQLRNHHETTIRDELLGHGMTRRVSGYNLDQLLDEHSFDLARALVGTEGTCATVLEATVDLVESPPARALCVLGFPDAYTAADHVMPIREHAPLTIEGVDVGVIGALRARRPDDRTHEQLPAGKGWLYVETGGADRAEAEAKAHAIGTEMATYGASVTVVSDPAAMRGLWKVREDGSGIVTRSPDGGEAWPGWEDAAVPPAQMGSYLREFDALLRRHGRQGAYYGHFGDGCLHVRIDFDLLTRPGLANFRAFLTDAADLVAAHGGSVSGEHGDGQARAELLARTYSPELLGAFKDFRAAWDPEGRMNPGRVVEPAKMDEDLKVFVGVPTIGPRTELAYTDDRGSFTRASRRCIGVAKCITDSGGYMCPSYRVTGEEMHSTRGRARMLFEMASGKLVPDGWRSTEVRDALDLCLSCKACQRDCPVGVDMATYKAEFLAQHYAGRAHQRPRSHWSMGHLPRWLRLAGSVPGLPRLANALARRPALATLAKRVGGIAPQRDIPALAPRPLRRVVGPHPPRPDGAEPRLLLWPDTFTAAFDPDLALDAIAVLEHLGYRVELPTGQVCCGLTWHTTGQLDTARSVVRRSLDVVKPWLDDGVAVVGLEPSCTAALRQDVVELLGPDDEDAVRLKASTRTLAEVLAQHTDELRAQVTTSTKAIAQIHCHQYAAMGFDADRAVLDALGVATEVLDAGCCGLAGNFGFEDGHYEVSTACAERALLPAVRAADPDTAVLADGFSCRTQIRQLAGTGHEPVHLAHVAATALGLRSRERASAPAVT